MCRALIECARNSWVRPSRFDHEFETPDPWGYLSQPQKRRRFELTLQMIEGPRNGARFRSAIEVGCAEGAFTQMLAPLCDSLLAVDFSKVALERAKLRCRGFGQVKFDSWDLRRDPRPGVFDLVLVMGVLEFFYRRGDLQAAREKIVTMLAPGGHLFLTVTRAPAYLESSFLARRFNYGGEAISRFMAEHAALKLISTSCEDVYVSSLFRKKPD